MTDRAHIEGFSAGDSFPTKGAVIEVHVAELKRLFHAIDPSPFREKDLDPKAEEFIVGWSKDLPDDAQLALLVYLDRPAGMSNEAAILKDAISEFFGQKAQATQRRLRQLLRIGRTSLMIGVAFLAALIAIGDFVANHIASSGLSEIVRESFLIGGWVAMWRPLEVFLYDWWPIKKEARLYDRLAKMPVRIQYTSDKASQAWKWDWPATPLANPADSDTATKGHS